MDRPSPQALFLEAVSAGIHGRHVQWPALPSELWNELFRMAERVHGADFCAALFRIAVEEPGIPPELPALWTASVPDPAPMLRDLLEGSVYGSSTKSRAHSARITQDAVSARRAGKRRSLRTAIFPPASSLQRDYPILQAHPTALPLVWQKRLLRYLRHSGRSAGDSPAETLRLGRQRLALLREYGILEDKPAERQRLTSMTDREDG